MHSIEILELGKRFWIPENLSECTRKQYLDMSKLILMYQVQDISLDQFRILGLYSLMDMQMTKSRLEAVQEEKMQNIYQAACQTIDTFFDIDEAGKMQLILDYVHNPVPSVHYRAARYYGPTDAFKNITWKQFVDGIGTMNEFYATKEMEKLVKLFAIFYKRKGEDYLKLDIERRVSYFKTLDVRYIIGFYFLFQSFYHFLRESSHILVHGREIDLSIIFNYSRKDDVPDVDTPPELGFHSLSLQIAESGTFGTKDQVDGANAWEILLSLYDTMARSLRREAEEEERRKNQKNS